MKIIKGIAALLLFAVAFSFVTACSEYAKGECETYDTGRILNPEDIEVIVSELKDEEEEPYVVKKNNLYYWTDSGSKFHLFIDCQSLSRSSDAISGRINEVPESIMESPCSFCLKRANLTKEDFLKKAS